MADRHPLQISFTHTQRRLEKYLTKGFADLEVGIQKRTVRDAVCNECLVKNISHAVATSVCFHCETYLCKKCEKRHDFHKGISKKTDCKTELAQIFLELNNEEDRREKIKETCVSLCCRIALRYKFDLKSGWITGMCGIEDDCILLCDKYNYCVKMLALNSKSIIRYIRFKEEPFDVAQIKLTQGSTEPSAESSTTSDEQKPVKNCLVAITLPWSREILFIDLSQYPAVENRKIRTPYECFGIEIVDDKIFTICSADSEFDLFYSLCIMSINGESFKQIIRHIPSIPHIALGSKSIYLIESENNIVTRYDMKGKEMSRMGLVISEMGGICLNDENTKVYVSSSNAVYEIDANLSGYKKLFEETYVNLKEAKCMCFQRGKLFVTHDSWSHFGNIISVISVI